MTFQFLCPQGHLLQGEEEHMGMQCQCPECGTAFIIPTIEGAAPAPSSASAKAAAAQSVDDLIAGQSDFELAKRAPANPMHPPAAHSSPPPPAKRKSEPVEDDVEDLLPEKPRHAPFGEPDPDETTDEGESIGEAQVGLGQAVSNLDESTLSEEVLHIPCPNGHQLESPLSMLGERVMCPHCGVEFRLRRENSIEFARQQEILERKRGQQWFQIAVVAASFVVVVLLVMIAMMMFS